MSRRTISSHRSVKSTLGTAATTSNLPPHPQKPHTPQSHRHSPPFHPSTTPQLTDTLPTPTHSHRIALFSARTIEMMRLKTKFFKKIFRDKRVRIGRTQTLKQKVPKRGVHCGEESLQGTSPRKKYVQQKQREITFALVMFIEVQY